VPSSLVTFDALPDPYLGGDRRVLTLPGAIFTDSGTGRQRELPVFSILYQMGEREVLGQTWLAVGRSGDRQEGWILREATEDWRSMLVLQYAAVGRRKPVVFFQKPESLEAILDSHFYGPDDALRLYSDIEAGVHDRQAIAAIEPVRPVNPAAQPYFMPIIDHREAAFEDIAQTPVYLLQLAMVNLQSAGRTDVTTDEELALIETEEQADALRDLKVGVVFVVDATLSMGPYIDEVRGFVRRMRANSAELGLTDNLDFGLFGYRDNLSADRRIGYVTEPFLVLGADVMEAEFNAALERIVPSPVSTTDWREDAFAGLEDAITRTDWTGYDARYVILVTDAGPRTLGDALARDANLGPRSIARLAERQGVSLSIIHMLTKDGAEDHQSAMNAYTAVAETQGGSIDRYVTVTGDAPSQFGTGLGFVADRLTDAISGLTLGQRVSREDAGLDDPLKSNTMTILERSGAPVEISAEAGQDALADTIIGELFRFQEEYLGALEGGEAPDFYRAWAADRDLIQPGIAAMDVKVLVTRDQLGDLTARLKDLIDRLARKETGSRDAFATIQDVSGRTAYDPSVRDLLPSYIAELPYKSRFLSLRADDWAGLGPQQQGEILQTVSDRIRVYGEIFSTEAGWLKLPGRAGGQDVYPLALDDLP